jgi:5-methylcytosine-specific restriction protein A
MPVDADRVAATLSAMYGIPLTATAAGVGEGARIVVRPSGVDADEAFAIVVRIGWMSLTAELVCGDFAGELVQAMGEPEPSHRAAFSAIAESVSSRGATLAFSVNGEKQNPCEPQMWPDLWRECTLRIVVSPMDIHGMGEAECGTAIIEWAGRLLALALALAATVVELEESAPQGGAVLDTSKRYERSRVNRAACLAIHGDRCCVCGMRFEEDYGIRGKGFIHVHHLAPVSTIGPDHIVNPRTDLVPVCPNCHAMLHRTVPPMRPADLVTLRDEAARSQRC